MVTYVTPWSDVGSRDQMSVAMAACLSTWSDAGSCGRMSVAVVACLVSTPSALPVLAEFTGEAAVLGKSSSRRHAGKHVGNMLLIETGER